MKIQKKNYFFFWGGRVGGGGGGLSRGRGSGLGDQGRCKQRSEVFVKTKKKIGGCRVGVGLGGVRMDFFFFFYSV